LDQAKEAMVRVCNIRALPLHLVKCLKFASAATQQGLQVVGTVVAMAMHLHQILNMNPKVEVVHQISVFHLLP
jgi:hypothetical protein